MFDINSSEVKTACLISLENFVLFFERETVSNASN